MLGVYSKKFRYEVVDSALKAYKTRNEADQEGERPLHRPKEWRKGEREQEKVRKKNDWYKRGGNEAVIFVPATPNSQLQRKYQKEMKRQGFKIKVVEKAGIELRDCSRDLIRVNRDDVKEKTAWYVERMEKDRVIDRA